MRLLEDLCNVKFADFKGVVGVQGLTKFQAVKEDVVGDVDEPLQVVERGCCIPSARKEQVLEVEKHNRWLFRELCLEILNRLHSSGLHLPRIYLRSRLDASANAWVRAVLLSVLILLKLADR